MSRRVGFYPSDVHVCGLASVVCVWLSVCLQAKRTIMPLNGHSMTLIK